MTEEQAIELAKNPQNIVYHYADREPLPKAVPLDKVNLSVIKCWEKYKDLRREVIAAHGSVTQASYKKIHKKLSIEFANFSFTHPLIFDRIVHPETTQKQIDTILWMIEIKREEPGDSGRVKLAKHVMDKFAVTKEEWDREHQNEPQATTIPVYK